MKPQRNARKRASRRIASQAGDAIIVVDAYNHIIVANAAAAALFGTSTVQMQGSALGRFLQSQLPEQPGLLAYFCSDTRSGRRSSDFGASGLHASGALLALEASLQDSIQHDARVTTIHLRDVSARQHVQGQLARSHEQLRQLSSTLQSVREEERTHIARELHDDLGQLLASLRMDLSLLVAACAGHPDAQRLIAGMDSNLLTAITSLRRIASNLRPRALDEAGLYFALRGLRDEFTARHGIACTLIADEAELRLDDATSTAIFRIAQEALTNIARHAAASAVTLNLYRIDGDLLITISDDGRGIRDADLDKPASLGLVGMRERVWALKGEIHIGSGALAGTQIDIVLPLATHTV